jgi:hypothetical protein
MFDHWDEFFLLAGSAAAVLIGLIFVVISLMSDRPRSSVLAGTRLYMGPVVLMVSFVLALSAAALVPGIGSRWYAALTAVIAVWGLARGLISFVGLRRLLGEEREVHWTDLWFYGAIPSALYVALGAVAAAFWRGCSAANYGLAAAITAALLLAIRNEWDLITWIAPKRDDGSGTSTLG